MINVKTQIKTPKIKFQVPTNDPKFWGGVGTDAATTIVERTLKGQDSNDRPFKPYTKATKEARKNRTWGYSTPGGRGQPLPTNPVTLSATGQMLKAIPAGVKARGNEVRIRLTGNQGFKAVMNEKKGRLFFRIGKKGADLAIKRALSWIRKKNKMR